jgi:hypothetical protein
VVILITRFEVLLVLKLMHLVVKKHSAYPLTDSDRRVGGMFSLPRRG